MPRGVAIPEIRQTLFSAVERVIVRAGPGGLSGRAVTREAGVASGLLYAHFTDLDEFLAGYAVDRAFQISAQAAALPNRAGTATVADNVTEFLLALPREPLLAAAKLTLARPEIAERVSAVLGERTAGLDAVEIAISDYLTAERRLGRVPPSATPEALALALVGAFHHLLLTGVPIPRTRERVRQLATTLAGSTTALSRRP